MYYSAAASITPPPMKPHSNPLDSHRYTVYCPSLMSWEIGENVKKGNVKESENKLPDLNLHQNQMDSFLTHIPSFPPYIYIYIYIYI